MDNQEGPHAAGTSRVPRPGELYSSGGTRHARRLLPVTTVCAARPAFPGLSAGSTMAVEIVGTLRAGAITVLLEVLALTTGLLIAANIQAIVALSARRRLYVHGTATLRDTTWNIGIVESIGNPRKMLRDCRSVFAFILAVAVLLLEALTVLQTQPGQSCKFYAPSTWTVQKGDHGCFKQNAGIVNADHFVSNAYQAVADVDVKYGIPTNTDVFEDSILVGPAVQQLQKYEERYVAGELDRFTVHPVVGTNGVSRSTYDDPSGRDSTTEKCGKENQEPGFSPLEAEYPKQENDQVAPVSITGFVIVTSCVNVMAVRVCRTDRRREFDSLAEDPVATNVTCDVHELDREGRQTEPRQLAILVAIQQLNSSDSIRRALLATIVAENSASQEPCKRYTAVPKACTSIGWVSLFSVLTLALLFIGSTVARIALGCVSKPAINWNSDEEHLVHSIFEHFDGTTRSKGRKKPGDVHVSVLQSGRELDAYHLAWTRDPVSVNPARRVTGNRVIPTADACEDEQEVSLV
jgi:hypothetical protein